MVHAAQKSEDPSPFSKDVKKAADSMSDKAAKDFASTKHKGLPDHVKESDDKWIPKDLKKGALHKDMGIPQDEKIPVSKLKAAAEKGGKEGKRAQFALNVRKEGNDITATPEEPTVADLDDMPSPVAAVSNEGITTTPTTHAPSLPTPTNNILWTATGRVCEGRPMVERIRMYEKKGGGWRMGKQRDEQVYNNLKEFYKNEIQPRKEAKELIVKRRMGEGYVLTPYSKEKHDDYFNDEWDKDIKGDDVILKQIIKNVEDNIKLLRKKLSDGKKLSPTAKDNLKKSIASHVTLLDTYKKDLKNLGEGTLKEDDMAEPGGDVVAKNGTQDHEVAMARASLLAMSKAVQDLMGKIGTNEVDLPGWVQDHITNAENYIVQAAKGYRPEGDLGNHIQRPEAQVKYSNGK